MQRRSMFHLLALLMAVLTFSILFIEHPSVQAAQTKSLAQHTQGASCLIPGVSTAPTSNFPRMLFAQQLLGKFPEYVAHYAQNTQAAKKKGATRAILEGCMIIGGVITAVGCIFIYYELKDLPF